MIELKAKDFCNILNLGMKLFQEDVILDFGSRLHIEMQDPAHVVALSVEVKRDLFKKYKQLGYIGIAHVADVYDAYSKKDGDFVLTYTDEDGLLLTYNSKLYTFKKRIKLVPVEKQDIDFMTNLKNTVCTNIMSMTTCWLVMSVDLLTEIVDELVRIKSDSIVFEYDGRLKIGDGDEIEFDIKDDAVIYEKKGKANSMVNPSLLKDILVKGKKIKDYTDSVKIMFGVNMPVVFQFTNKNFDIVYIIAPRLASD